MRAYQQLEPAEQELALALCLEETLQLIRDGVIAFSDTSLQSKIDHTTNNLQAGQDIIEVLILDSEFSAVVREMAKREAEEAEYPSKNELGLYKKVIQL